jgi:6-phosphogluconolactonase
MSIEVTRFPTRAALDVALVTRLLAVLDEARAASGPTGLMLAGGSTPLAAYRALAARSPAPAPHLTVLYSDDRYVPATSDASNYHQTQALLAALALPPSQILRVRTELPLTAAASDYGEQLAALLARGARVPLGLLGLGADGHTASLFSPTDLKEARGRLALAVQRPDGLAGVSATPEFFAHVEEISFVVAGPGKQGALRQLLAEDPQLTAWAAVRSCPKVTLWLDADAAQGLPA